MATASFERCGRYELREVLGEGGMGTVYRAWDPELARVVAIKIVHGWPLDESHFERFRREAQLLARVPHPHIVNVFDIGSAGDEPFIVMELVEGQSLAEAMAEGRALPFEEKLRAAVQICGALSCAHAAGVVHRDVKPANILLTKDGVAKLADFGIARLPGMFLTNASHVLGSPAYLAPEVFDGHPADARSDIYGLAACIYEWLSGTRPHESDDYRVLAARVVQQNARPLSDAWPDCPPSLECCVHRGLSRNPDARFQTADAFAAELRALLGEAPAVPDPVGVRRARRSFTAGQWRALAVGGALAGIMIAGGLLWKGRAEPMPEAVNAPAAEVEAAGPTEPPSAPADDSVRRRSPPASDPPARGETPGTARSVAAGDEPDEEVPLVAGLPVGTSLRAWVISELRTDRSLAGHAFEGALSEPVMWHGQRVAEAGARVQGLVHEVGGGGRDSPPFLQLSLTSMAMSGTDVPIRTARYRVVAPPAAGGESLRVLIIGAAFGALAGAAIGGPEGAVTGGALGAALTRPSAATSEPVVLNAPLTFKLAAPLPLPMKLP